MRRRAKAGVLVVAGLLAAAGCQSEPAADPTPTQRSAVEHGAELFGDPALSKFPFNAYSCATCHEALGGPTGARLVVGAPLSGVVKRTSYWGGAEIDLLRAVNHCLRFFMLQDQPWSGQEPEAEAIYAYLESISGPGTEGAKVAFTIAYAAEDIAPREARRGEALFDRACATCHGAAHTGTDKLVDYAPTLPEDALTEHPLGLYTRRERRLVVVEKVRHGGFLGYGGQMPPFSRELLSDEELGDLLAFFDL
jgi:thiosulfate dehydrogenase